MSEAQLEKELIETMVVTQLPQRLKIAKIPSRTWAQVAIKATR
jgi:hypothetical protein